MAEFAGYVGNLYPPTDWGKISADLFKQIDQEKLRRKTEKDKIETDYADTYAKIGEYEQTTDQDVNEFIYKGVNEVRNAYKMQYDLLKKGAIEMSDYKLFKSTASSDLTNLNKAVKNFGEINATNQRLITEGKMSGLGQYNALGFAKLGDLKTAKLMVNPQTGRLYRTNIDPKTGKVSSANDVYSPSAMLNPGNLVDLKINIDDQTTSFLKRLGEVGVAKDLGNGKIEIVESAKNNPAYKSALDNQVKAITATPRQTTSVLTDYIGDYKFYDSDAKKSELINSGFPANKLISVVRKNGVAEPVLTADQEAEAEKFVRNQIEVGVGSKKSLTQGFAPRDQKTPTSADKKEEKRVATIERKSAIVDDIWAQGTKSQHQKLLRTAALARGLDNPQIKMHYTKDANGNVFMSSIDIVGNEMIVKANGSRQKGGLTTRTLRNPEDIYTFISNKQDPLSASSDYQEGSQQESGPTSNAKGLLDDL